MRHTIQIITVILVLFYFTESVYSQIEAGDIELSASASFMYRKHETAEKAWLAFVMALRAGYFFNSQIEIEPEMTMSKLDKEKTGYIFSVNFAYNFNPLGSLNNVSPFLIAGVGISNTMAFVPNFAWIGYKDEKKLVLNAGGGLKIFISQSVAIRFEYRYQKYISDEDLVYHNALLGFSVFL